MKFDYFANVCPTLKWRLFRFPDPATFTSRNTVPNSDLTCDHFQRMKKTKDIDIEFYQEAASFARLPRMVREKAVAAEM
jgi:hypothetical protein